MQVVKTESFNTNNDWGFGGAAGVYTYYDNGLVVKKGKAYFRHSPPESFEYVLVNYDNTLLIISDLVTSLKGLQKMKVESVSVYKSEDDERDFIIARTGEEAEINYHGTLLKKVKTIYL